MHFEFVRTPTFVLPGLMDARGVLHNWLEDFRYLHSDLSTDWGYVNYTMHPQVIGRGHRMRMLESLIVTLRREGAVFARVTDVASQFDHRSPYAQP